MAPDVAIRHERVLADGVELHVARAGAGPPVILLHGFPENWRSWKHQIPALAAAGFSVWAPDLRGYNLSDRPTRREAYHLRHLVADVAALVRATGAPRAHVAGHDWGGIVAWTFAGHHPDLLDKLLILNAPHLRLYEEQARRLPQLLRAWYVLLFRIPWVAERALSARDFSGIRRILSTESSSPRRAFTEREVEEYVETWRPPGALTAALNYYRANAVSDARALAREAEAAAPTLVIWGDLDPALSTDLLIGLPRVARKVRVHRLRDVSHWVQNEAPDRVNQLMTEFLTAENV